MGEGGGDGGGDSDSGDGVSSSRREAASAPVAWEGPRGGDAVLAAVIGVLTRSSWSQQCVRRGVAPADAKARTWQLVASHLPGRTATECQERWQQLCRSRSDATDSTA